MARTAKQRGLTQTDMTLVAVYRAAEGKPGRVPYEEIVVSAWREFPEAFSLRNYPQYPDASDIHKRIYQGLKPQGLVVSLGNKMFRLTDAGVERAEAVIAELEGVVAPEAERPARLTREEAAYLRHARNSRALAIWREGEAEKLIDFDAQIFFRFSTGTDRPERGRRVSFALAALEKAKSLDEKDAEDLEALGDFLASAFEQMWKGE